MFKIFHALFPNWSLRRELKRIREDSKIILKENTDKELATIFQQWYSDNIDKGEHTMNDSYTGSDLILYERGYEAGLSGLRMDVYDEDDPYDQGVKDAVEALTE